jgi:hypothetical protein
MCQNSKGDCFKKKHNLEKISEQLLENSALGSGDSAVIKSLKVLSFNADKKPHENCKANIEIITKDNVKVTGDLQNNLKGGPSVFGLRFHDEG